MTALTATRNRGGAVVRWIAAAMSATRDESVSATSATIARFVTHAVENMALRRERFDQPMREERRGQRADVAFDSA